MLLCETSGLTSAARQIALAAMQAVDSALPEGPAAGEAWDSPREQRRGRLAGNLFAYCLQAGDFEVRCTSCQALIGHVWDRSDMLWMKIAEMAAADGMTAEAWDSPEEQRRWRLAGNLFACCLQASDFEMRCRMCMARGAGVLSLYVCGQSGSKRIQQHMWHALAGEPSHAGSLAALAQPHG